MNFLDMIRRAIRNLFGKRSVNDSDDQQDARNRDKYEDTKRISFDSIFATALSNKAVSDSTLTVQDIAGNDSRRSIWISEGLGKIWKQKKDVVAQALGKGGKVLVPYVANGKAYVDAVDQSRMMISATNGDEITSASILADIGNVNGVVYYRFADYTLADGVHTIRNRATTASGGEVELNTVPEWAMIEPEIVISGVDHILFGYLKCPQDSRKDKQIRGVPITYGSEEIIQDIYECLDDMKREYRLKRPFVGADERMFGKGNQLPENGLFKKFNTSGGLKDGEFWQIFDPAIRDSSYLARFQQLCGMLESSVGVSPGILTEPRTANATATEIKSANAATFAMVDSIRENVETAFAQLAYALDVLAEFYGATPAGAMGDWQIVWDWDMSMMESSTETFNQLSELESRGLILPERLVAWTTGMSMEDAKAEVESAQALQPKTVDVLLKEE